MQSYMMTTAQIKLAKPQIISQFCTYFETCNSIKDYKLMKFAMIKQHLFMKPQKDRQYTTGSKQGRLPVKIHTLCRVSMEENQLEGVCSQCILSFSLQFTSNLKRLQQTQQVQSTMQGQLPVEIHTPCGASMGENQLEGVCSQSVSFLFHYVNFEKAIANTHGLLQKKYLPRPQSVKKKKKI